MKASELRIGNIFNETIRGHNNEFIIAAVNSLTNTGIDINNNITSIDYLEPIPITEECLLKFGINLYRRYSENSEYFIDNKYKIIYVKDGESYLYMYDELIRKIEFVHHLQNIFFDLKNEELEIKGEQSQNKTDNTMQIETP